MNELQVDRHAGAEIEAELDRRDWPRNRRLALRFLYRHFTNRQLHELLLSTALGSRDATSRARFLHRPVFLNRPVSGIGVARMPSRAIWQDSVARSRCSGQSVQLALPRVVPRKDA